jgi:putative salt-induced outer membrane protein YdiY
MIEFRTGALPVILALGLVVAAPAVAQEAVTEEATEEEIPKNWSNEGNFAWINTSGNGASSSFGFSNTFKYNWTYSELILFGDIFKATARTEERFNEGGGVRQVLTTTTTAERYDFRAKFRQNILENLFWYALGGYYRNRPAGIDSRWLSSAGVGYRFLETPTTTLVGEIGLGVTRENPVGADGDTFIDMRANGEWQQRVSDSTNFSLYSEFLLNLQNTKQLRINSGAALTTAINSKLALRLAWDMRFNNDPPTIFVDTNPNEPAAPFQLKTSDRTLAASFVLTL